jgi:hypothetical protein
MSFSSSYSSLFPLLFSFEKPLAILALQNTITTIIAKSIGLAWIPSLNNIFISGSKQYPRKHNNETTKIGIQWDIFYFVLYGTCGMYAQYMGYLWTINRVKDTDNDSNGFRISTTVKNQAKALGLFHMCIGLHHGLWGLFPKYGQLTLDDFFGIGNRIPYLLEGLAGIMTGYHGYKLFTTSGIVSTTPPTADRVASKLEQKEKEIQNDEASLVRHKIMCDLSSLCSLIPIFGYWPINILGMTSSRIYDQSIWLTTIFVPLTLLSIDFLSYNNNNATTTSTTTHSIGTSKLSNNKDDSDTTTQ